MPNASPLTTSMISASVIAALFCGFIFGVAFQKQREASSLDAKDAMILAMQKQLSARMETVQVPPLPPSVPPFVVPPPPVIGSTQNWKTPVALLLTPREGQRLCRGEYYAFSWKADPSQVDEVSILITSSTFPGGTVFSGPVTYNETGAEGEGSIDWLVGTAMFGNQRHDIPDGELYHLEFMTLKRGQRVSLQESPVFSVDTCKG